MNKKNIKVPAIKKIEEGNMEGEVDIYWNRIEGAKSYIVQVNSGMCHQCNWQHADISEKSDCTVTSLKKNKEYFFRISALTTGGQGPWSNAVKIILH